MSSSPAICRTASFVLSSLREMFIAQLNILISALLFSSGPVPLLPTEDWPTRRVYIYRRLRPAGDDENCRWDREFLSRPCIEPQTREMTPAKTRNARMNPSRWLPGCWSVCCQPSTSDSSTSHVSTTYIAFLLVHSLSILTYGNISRRRLVTMKLGCRKI